MKLDPSDEVLAGRVDELLEVDTARKLRVIRALERVLVRRLEIETRPLDLFTLPHDLPTWDELYADLVARAIVETGTIAKAAEVIGKARSTLYVQLSKGLLDAHAARDPSLARLLLGLLGAAAEAG